MGDEDELEFIPDVDAVVSSVDDVERAVGKVEVGVEGVKAAVEGVEAAVEGVERAVEGVGSVVERVQSAVEGLEKGVGGVESAVGRVENVSSDIERAVGDVGTAIETCVARVEDAGTALRDQVDNLAIGAARAVIALLVGVGLAFVLHPPNGYDRRVIVYPVGCEGTIVNQECVGHLGKAEPRESFRAVAERQEVMHGDDFGNIVSFRSTCGVQDSENWMCSSTWDGRIRVWTMREGKLTQPDDAESGHHHVYVPWWQWWLRRFQ